MLFAACMQCCNKSPLLESQVKSSQKYSSRESIQVIAILFKSSQVTYCSSQVKSSHVFLQVTSSQYGVVYSPFVKWQKYFVNCVVISMTVHKNPKWGGVNHLDIDTSEYQFYIFSPKIKWEHKHGSQLHVIHVENHVRVCVITRVTCNDSNLSWLESLVDWSQHEVESESKIATRVRVTSVTWLVTTLVCRCCNSQQWQLLRSKKHFQQSTVSE